MNADGLSRSTVERRRLVTPGGAAYAALVVPRAAAMQPETADRIAALAERGLPVIFLDLLPDRDEGLRAWRTRDAAVKSRIDDSLRAGAQLAPETQLIDKLHELGVAPNLRFVQGGSLPFVERRIRGRRLFFLYNPEAQTRDVLVEVDSQVAAQRWDAWSGKIETLPIAARGQLERLQIATARPA